MEQAGTRRRGRIGYGYGGEVVGCQHLALDEEVDLTRFRQFDRVRVDTGNGGAGEVIEADETNNTRVTVPVRVFQPDLATTALTVKPRVTAPGMTVSVTQTVKNLAALAGTAGRTTTRLSPRCSTTRCSGSTAPRCQKCGCSRDRESGSPLLQPGQQRAHLFRIPLLVAGDQPVRERGIRHVKRALPTPESIAWELGAWLPKPATPDPA